MKKLFLGAGAAMMIAFGAPAAADAKPGHGAAHGAHGVKAKPAKVKVATVKPAKIKARSWATACPAGLVWRGPRCLPPGHAKKLLAVGTRVPRGWSYTPWGTVPLSLRNQYDLDPDYRYIYRDNVIYVVDPQTRLISSIISAIL